MTASRIGVFVCHCGGNISDHVDVERVRAAAAAEPGVAVARTLPFACSDAAQQEMTDAIRGERLDGIAIASCSPKLHLETFRSMAARAGLNPYMYTQVNVREQCSWAHRRDARGATEKAVRLVRAGIAGTRLGRPLTRMRVEALPAALVVGAGAAGMRAAVALADVGLSVHLVERERRPGGRVPEWGKLFPSDRTGSELVTSLFEEVLRRSDRIAFHPGAEIVEKKGSAGRFSVKLRTGRETTSVEVGAIVVATGFEPYAPPPGEFGRGLPGVLTLPELKELLATSSGGLRVNGRDVRTIAYLYCVGSRQSRGTPGARTYCSRYCCTAAVHAAIEAHRIDPALDQFHLYRDMRSYGRNELLFEEAGRRGSVFVRVPDDAPPAVAQEGDGLVVRVRDELADGEELEIPADLVVLVTGMVPRENAKLRDVLKLPLGADGFFNEIHPKLRPVETMVDGVFLAGTAQGPKTFAESVTSSLAAAAKCSSLLLRGHIDRAPIVAAVNAEACTWCGECAAACPYDGAIVKAACDDRQVARVQPELCKGCGACVPVCAPQAIEVEGYGTSRITAMIDALAAEVAP